MALISFKDSFNEQGITFIKIENLFFHPQGGGQPNDKLFDRNSTPIIIRKVEGEFYLGVQPSTIEDGKVEVFIDESFNKLCSRLHSAGHLLALVSQRDFSIQPVKAHHFPHEAYIKFEGILDKAYLEELSEKIAIECKNNLSVTISHNEKERFVNFDGLGGYPCGGTHVNFLSEIGDIQLTALSHKKGMTTIKYTLADVGLQ